MTVDGGVGVTVRMAGEAVTKRGVVRGATEDIGRTIWQVGKGTGGEDVVGADGE